MKHREKFILNISSLLFIIRLSISIPKSEVSLQF